MALNSSNFQILVNAVLDAKNIQAQLDKISQKYATMKVGIDVDTSKLNSALSGLKGLKVGFDDTTTSADKTSQSIGDIFTKVSKFGGVTLVINELRQSLMDGVDAVKELDAAVTEYKKVSDITDEGMKQYIEDAREMGLEVGRTATEAMQAAATFKKMGYSDQESLQLAKISSMFQNVADTAITAGESASFVNSQMKAFSMTTEDAEHIISAVNEVANNFALGTNDLAQALQISASGIAVLGNSFEDTIGMITSGLEVMPGQAAKIGRSIVSFGNNLAKTAQSAGELTYNVQGTAKSLSLLDSATGETKSTMQILKDLKSDWDAMTDSERQSLALAVGSKTQFSTLSAILQNLNSGVEASKTALNSQGSALKENARYLDSIQGKVSQFTSELEKFWTEGISSDNVKTLVEFGTETVRLINDLGGLPTVLAAISGAMATMNASKIVSEIGKVERSVESVITTFISGVSATGKLRGGFSALLSLANPLTLGFAAVSTAVVMLVSAYQRAQQHQEQMMRTAQQEAQTYNDTATELEKLKDKYDEITSQDYQGTEEQRTKELAEIHDILAEKYSVEDEALQGLNGSREEAIGLIDKEIEKNAKEVVNKNIEAINKAKEELSKPITIDFKYAQISSVQDVLPESFKNILTQTTDLSQHGKVVSTVSADYEIFKNAVNDTIDVLKSIENPTESQTKAMNYLSEQLNKAPSGYEEAQKMLENYASAIVKSDENVKTFLNSTYDSVDAMKQQYDATVASLGGYQSLTDALNKVIATNFPDDAKLLGIEIKNSGNKASEAANGFDEYGDGIEDAKTATEEATDRLKDLSDALSNTQSAYEIFTQAAKEYNETGNISVDTLSKLIKVNPEYWDALNLVDGKLVVNKEKLDEMNGSILDSVAAELVASGAFGDFSDVLGDVAKDSETAGTNAKTAGTNIATSGSKAATASVGYNQVAKSMLSAAGAATQLNSALAGATSIVGGTYSKDDFLLQKAQDEAAAQQRKRAEEYQKAIEEARKMLGSGLTSDKSTSSSKGGKGSGSKSSTSDAEKQAKADAKAYKEAFEKELAALDKQKSLMKDNAATDKWYYEQLEELTNKYYKDKEGYEDEYNKYHEKALDGMTKAHDSAYNERYELLKHQLAMDMISEEEYYDELEELMKEFYSNEELYAEQRWKIEEELYSGRKKLEEEVTKKAEEEAEKRKKARKEEWEEEKQWYEEQQSNLETAFAYVSSLAQKEIDKLNERKQAIQDQYDAEIDKINEKNDAIDEEIELQEKLDALAKAQQKKVRIYREGEGFVYETDQSAVDEAKSALTQYKKEQDTKKEIKRLEDIRDATIDSVEQQIKYWEKYKDAWGNVTDDYTTEQNKLIAEQVLGISLEGENWEKRLGNLQDYVDRYNEIMSTLKTRYSKYEDDDDEEFGDELDPEEQWSDKEPTYSHGSGGDNWYEDDTSHGPGAYANGTTTGYGLSMVGEKGREIRVLGTGTNEGDGIIPNHLTENLMQLGKFSPVQWINSIVGKMGGQSAPIYNYAFDNLVLPNVTNGDSFINELKNLKNRALQMGGRRD